MSIQLKLDLSSDAFRDKVLGCWLGKNCGGTLGAPLEKGFGEPEPFDVWWYPELREGGIPNDDLEMQLIWLKALEEVGPGLKAADLAYYWLNHIGYNWDEYGLSKTNLRLGLLPPASGNYNNWFRDCMGSPIRSEIWACAAPGVPRLAVRFAYEDAICDHAGGEGVYGELFNTAIESAAFVVSDSEELIKIGLSYVPPTSQTAKAVNTALDAYHAGLDWKEARAKVLEAVPHYNAQYSPINMAFQVIGWLYGNDFGDTLCKAVNCGYDTDCTGATVGSILGILLGRKELPAKWTEPLGEDISTNESWGGVKNLSVGVNPVPQTLDELTDRVCAQAKRVLAAHNLLQDDCVVVDPESLYADESVKELWQLGTMSVSYSTGLLPVEVNYIDTPAILPNEEKTLRVKLDNPHVTDLPVQIIVHAPLHWPTSLSQPSYTVTLKAEASTEVEVKIQVPDAVYLQDSNRLLLEIVPEGWPAQPAVPIVLIGGQYYLHSQVYTGSGLSNRELFDYAFEPEQKLVINLSGADERPGTWTPFYALDNEVKCAESFQEPGVIYIRTFIKTTKAIDHVWMGTSSTFAVKMWVNGEQVVSSYNYPLLRPNYGGNK